MAPEIRRKQGAARMFFLDIFCYKDSCLFIEQDNPIFWEHIYAVKSQILLFCSLILKGEAFVCIFKILLLLFFALFFFIE